MPTTYNSEAQTTNIYELQGFVVEEFGQHRLLRADLHKTLFSSKVFATDVQIGKYIRQSGSYDTEEKRWVNLPQTANLKLELYIPIQEIILEILQYFDYNETRSVIDTHGARIDHKTERTPDMIYPPRETTLKSAPDLMITGSGKIGKEKGYNFGPAAPSKDSLEPSYLNCVTPVEIKLYRDCKLENHVGQISVYARNCFIQQQNRNFVFSLLLSESTAQLLMFDRSGLCYSQEVNIHENPEDFVRMILGVSFPDCAVVGFDTRVYWKKDKYRYISVPDKSRGRKVYRIAHDKGLPYFFRDTIRGRGTCCWMIRKDKNDVNTSDEPKKFLIVKDQWASRGREREWKFNEAVKDMQYICKMVGYEEGRSIISHLRGISNYEGLSKDEKDSFPDRVFCRNIFEYGGKPISKFESKEELLLAFRDAIKGHQNLWEAGIVHRDISVHNILIAPEGSDVRGTLIDLDMATRISDDGSLAKPDFRVGVRIFQSVNVLNSFDRDKLLRPHDYFDDIESLYLLRWLTEGYEAPHKFKETLPKHLFEWKDTPLQYAAGQKSIFISSGGAPFQSDYFGEVFETLVEDVHRFLLPKIRERLYMNTVDKTLQKLQVSAKQDYAELLRYVDKAIKALATDKASLLAAAPSEPIQSGLEEGDKVHQVQKISSRKQRPRAHATRSKNANR